MAVSLSKASFLNMIVSSLMMIMGSGIRVKTVFKANMFSLDSIRFLNSICISLNYMNPEYTKMILVLIKQVMLYRETSEW